MSYQQTGTPQESVPQNDQAKQMSATVSDSRDEEFSASAGWHFLCRNNFTGRRLTTIELNA